MLNHIIFRSIFQELFKTKIHLLSPQLQCNLLNKIKIGWCGGTALLHQGPPLKKKKIENVFLSKHDFTAYTKLILNKFLISRLNYVEGA